MPITLSRLRQSAPPPVAPDVDLRTRAAAALQAIDRLLAVTRALQSTIAFSLWMVQQDGDFSETDLLAALDRLAQHIARRWRVYDKDVKAELRRRMADAGTDDWMAVKREVLTTALWLVLRGDINEPQTVCLPSDGWLVDETGHKVCLAPDDLPFPIAVRWAQRRVVKVAEALLLERSHARQEATGGLAACISLDDPRIPALQRDLDADADPLYLMLEQETAANDREQYAAVWELATPAQRRLLTELRAQLEAGRSMTDGAIAAAAGSLGISAATARVQLHSLRSTVLTARSADDSA